MNYELLFEESLKECGIHKMRILYAKHKLEGIFPASLDVWNRLTNEDIEAMDQLVFRFIRLQDALGLRVFPRLLAYLREPFEDAPMIDKLNRLEKIGYLDSAEEWQRLRNMRNNLAHEYPDEPEENCQNFNQLFENVDSLIAIYEHIKKKYFLNAGARD